MLYPEEKSLNQPPKRLIVFLHGVGSDGYDLIDLVPYIRPELPDCHFISPHGIEPYDMASFGRQWFSLKDRSPNILIPLLTKSTCSLERIIGEKQKELGFTSANTIIIGFSQGTMLGLYLTL